MRVGVNNAPSGAGSARMVLYFTAEEFKHATGQVKPFENSRCTLRRDDSGKWSLQFDKMGHNKVQHYETAGRRGSEHYVATVSFGLGDWGYKWVTPWATILKPEFSGQKILFTFTPPMGNRAERPAEVDDPISVLKKAKADFNAAIKLLIEAGYEVKMKFQASALPDAVQVLVLTGEETLTARLVVTKEETF